MHDTRTNIHITYILDEYIKNKNVSPDDYVTADEKSFKIDLYKTSIIAVNTLNGPDIIILIDIVYYFIFFINIVSAKCF